MAKIIEKMIQDVSFPRQGDYFAMIPNPIEILSDAGAATIIKDRSHRDSVFLCTESDAVRVVARIAHGYFPDYGRTHIFHRAECRFDDVAHLLPALGIHDPKSCD